MSSIALVSCALVAGGCSVLFGDPVNSDASTFADAFTPLPDADDSCAADACSDGMLNCGEADVDCGGPCWGCADGKTCAVVEDCLTGECVGNTCESAPGCRPTVNVRSIGINAIDLASTGTATIAQGSITMSFSAGLPAASLPGGVGLGDEIKIGASTFHIVAHNSATELTVQPASDTSIDDGTFTISRAFTSVAAWESATQGDLVASDTREQGIVYADGLFSEGTITISGSTTNSCNYRWLNAARGHRHAGIAADQSGVVATPGLESVVFKPAGPGSVFEVSEDYFRASWLELTGFQGLSSEGFRVNNTGFLLENSLVHSAKDKAVDGIHIRNFGVEVRILNSVFYDLGRMAVHVQDCDDPGQGDNIMVTLTNSTIFNMGQAADNDDRFTGGVGYSVCEFGQGFINTAFIVTNTYVHSLLDEAYVERGGGTFAGSSSAASGDGSAPGVDALRNLLPAEQFMSLVVPVDPHLKPGSLLIDEGDDLSTQFSGDIDGAQRSVPWDIGADEFASP